MDYAKEIYDLRNVLIEYSSKNPGFHLAPSLGIVELSIAIMEIFDLKKHKIIFDIGHQRYPFVMLMNKKFYGKAYEISKEIYKYDIFLNSTFAGLSTAMASGLSLVETEKVLLIIGDGALTSGEVYEGLNYLGQRNNDLLVIYNYNDMSIGCNTGTLTDPNNIKKFAESFNFEYYGIIDGHDLNKLMLILSEIKNKVGKIFLHIRTQKGKGFLPAEKNPISFHQPFTRFNKNTGVFYNDTDPIIKNLDLYLTTLQAKCETYLQNSSDIFCIFPATPFLQDLIKKFPDRVIDVGIAEQTCITMATSLALTGKKVIIPVFASFLSRCFSQIIDMCISDTSVTLIVCLPGLTPLGIVTQALHITNLIRLIPNCSIIQASNLKEFEYSIDFALASNKINFIQTPKIDYQALSPNSFIEYGKGDYILKGSRLTILPLGSMFEHVNTIVQHLDNIEVINPRFLKPLDYQLIFDSVKKTKKLLILEDAYVTGSIGVEVKNIIMDKFKTAHIKLLSAKNIFVQDTNYKNAQTILGISTTQALETANELYHL